MRYITVLFAAFYLTTALSSGYAEEICSLSEYLPEGTDFKINLSDPETIKVFVINIREDLVIDNLPLRNIDISTAKIKKNYVWKNELDKVCDGEIDFAQKGQFSLEVLKGEKANKVYVFEYSKGHKMGVNIPKDQEVLLNLLPGLQLQIDDNERKKLQERFKNKNGEQDKEDTYLTATLPAGTSVAMPLDQGLKLEMETKKGGWFRETVKKKDKAWIEVEGSARAATGNHITMSVRQLGSPLDLAKVEKLEVCFRGQGEKDIGRPYLRSPEVEVLEESGKNSTKMLVEIPDFSNRLPEVPLLDLKSFLSFKAAPVQIKVIGYDDQGNITLEATEHYAISRVGWALFIAALALLFGYMLPVWLSQKRLKHSPIWLARGITGKASLSKFQIWIWTLLVFSSMIYVFVISGQLIQITDGILILLGITGGSSLGAKFTAIAREDRGLAVLTAKTEEPVAKPEPEWKDLISTSGDFDIFKFQMLLFTGLVALYVFFSVVVNLQFPEVPESFMWLMGISNGVYLGGKFAGTSVFGELVALHAKLEGIKEKLTTEEAKLKKLKAEKTETEAKLAEAEKENKDLDRISELKTIKEGIIHKIADTEKNIKKLKDKNEEIETKYNLALEKAQKLTKDE